MVIKLKKTYGTKVTAYLDGFQYEDNVLQFMPTAEGYYDFLKNTYIYNYNDHLENVRLSYSKNPSTGALEIIEENNYYAFGLKHEGYNPSVPSTTYNYKFQEQELQESGFYAFKWRQYVPDVGRFFNIDPLAEKYPYNSIYAFSENKVVAHREIEGLEAE